MATTSRRAHVEDAMDIDAPPRAPSAADPKMKALERQLEHSKLARQIAVPTALAKIKARLRDFEEPVTLFGEKPEDRRQRLREVLTSKVQQAVAEGVEIEEAIKLITESSNQEEEEEVQEEPERRVPGGVDLLEARMELAKYTVGRAKKRIAYQRAEAGIQARKQARLRTGVKDWLGHFEIAGSQVYGPRITSALKFTPNGQFLAAGTWGGRVALLDLELEPQLEFRGHSAAPVVLTWDKTAFPMIKDDTRRISEILESCSGVYMATGDGAGPIRLFASGQMQEDIEEEAENPMPFAKASQVLEGHSQRVTALEFHPFNKYLISGSHDETWCLWDLEKSMLLMPQRAHVRGIHCLALNVDGSLLATGGLDSYARVWDLRTGAMVMQTDGHVQPVYGVDWSPNGYRFMSGAADGKLKVWDLRKNEEYAELPAHQNGVSAVKWFKGMDGPLSAELPPMGENGEGTPKLSGTFFVTAGFDKELRVWSADDWSLVAELGGHTGNITCLDITEDAKKIATGSRDMTIKLWTQPDGSGIYEQNL